MSTTYSQPSKRAVRELALSHAVDVLTANRHAAPVVRESYVREVAEHLVRAGTPYDQQIAGALTSARISSWERFHRAHVGSKNPEDLKVCYLAGPEPLNDFRVLVELGIHPHNIWAFEADANIYGAAVEALGGAEFPFLKLFKGTIDQFAQHVPMKFDVIYIDACGPLPSRSQKTLKTLSTILSHQRLESPGVLISNFAHPDLTNEVEREFFTFLVGSYLYPKDFLEGLTAPFASFSEGPLVHGFEPDSGRSFADLIRSDFHYFYGQYITRQLFDLASLIVPWMRLANSTAWAGLFTSNPKSIKKEISPWQSFSADDDGGDIIVEPGCHPLSWTFCAMRGGGYAGIDNNFPTPSQEIESRVDDWFHQLSGSPARSVTAREAAEWADLLRERTDLYSDRFAQAVSEFGYRQAMFQFCDVPTAELAFDLLIRQLAFPMHYTVDAVRRWTYTAKQTQMFTDVIVLDACRYVYDWMPTVDLLRYGFTDECQQLAYRFALDGLVKNRRWYNSEYFYGGAVVDQDTAAFEARLLRPRESITK